MKPSFWWRLTMRALHATLLLGALVLLVATAAPAWQTDYWLVRYLGYPTLQFLILGVVLASLLAVLPVEGWPGIRWCNRLAIASLALATAWNGARLTPYTLPLIQAGPAVTVPAGSCPTDQRLRLLEVNVQMTNQHDSQLLDMIRQIDPDVAWFQETDAWWEGQLAPLASSMPFGAERTQANYFGVHLFSKLPLSDVQVQTLTDSRNPSVVATATLPSNRTVRIHAIHPRPPQIGQSTAERDAQLMAASLQARGDTIPHLIVGDLNTVPWEDALHRTEQVAGVRDPRIGRGLFITWNAHRWLAKWPLDHVLPGGGISLSSLRVLPAFGSDHRPMVADLCISNETADLPPLSEQELQEVQHTIERGQGKAVQQGARTPPGTDKERN